MELLSLHLAGRTVNARDGQPTLMGPGSPADAW